ncbi:MAG: DnaJ domain-containing protein [Halolamina sp.]|uniref:DnaJ domain-containing protein n=1 Tax=Halolamina sp. TaxID=1940283 RepID=UPI002FC3C728
MPTDFYDVLGATADASSKELKRAYRAQVREYHPDVNDHPEGDEQFKLIRKAHDVLSNSAERKDYDRMGHREYADKRLDDLPPLSVFPEAEDGGPAEPASETTVDSADSVHSDGESTEGSGGASASRSPSTSTSSSSRSSRNRSSNSSRSSGGSQSRSTQSSSSSRSTGGSQSNSHSRSTRNSRYTGRSTSTRSGASTNSTQSQSTGRSRGTSSTGADRSDSSWDDVTEQTARAGASRSSTTAAAARRRRGLGRWYGIVLLSLLAYVAGIGTYAAPHGESLRGLGTGLATSPVPTLSAGFPLPSPSTYVLGTATAAASGEPGVGLLFLVGAVALPLVVLTAVAQFGQGSAWIYALASLGPVVPLAVERVAALPTVVALIGLVVLPLVSGLAFLIDVGRYLYATR